MSIQLLDHLFNVHRQKWAQRVQCGRCNIWLNERADLAKHLRTHPAEVHKCPNCDKISPTANALKCHIRAVHSERTHKCSLCEKVFRTVTAMKVRSRCFFFSFPAPIVRRRWLWVELLQSFFNHFSIIFQLFSRVNFPTPLESRGYAYAPENVPMRLLQWCVSMALEYVRTSEENASIRLERRPAKEERNALDNN